MSWGLDALALDRDADERAIKRAYAQRLRVTRPEDDLVAFQQLHEAYQAALAWARGRTAEEAPGPGSGPEAPLPPTVLAIEDAGPQVDDQVQSGQRVDVEAIAGRILTEAVQQEPEALQAWLAQQPELWPLQWKAWIGDALLDALFTGTEPVQADNLDVLAELFGWDEIGSSVDPYALDAQRLQMHRHWVVQPGNHHRLAELLQRCGLPSPPAAAREHMAWLSRPWNHWQALLTSLSPQRGRDLNQTLDALGIDDGTSVPAPLQARQIAFWRDIGAMHRLNRERWLQGLLRGVACALIAALLVLSVGVLGQMAIAHSVAGIHPLATYARVALFAALALVLLGALAPAVQTFLHWQVQQEQPHRSALAALLPIPLLAIVAIVLIHGLELRTAGTLLAWPVLGLSVWRWWRRSQLQIQFNGWLLLSVVPFLKLLILGMTYAELPVALAVALWARDAWTQVWRRP
ncbi:J domain-containing protein [Stenotrophomonas beteli]|uniref:Molecular chaperone DnaJ n=1 Tax=Stenotrophomonas beteli TaxID=3384461 RepID=A0A0R0B3P0_9GAMM|nr:J domain-containing protein [Stenotrophomonas maltophilia]KRG48558.1 hypothetical protein ARC23_01660 [Stenotrophomonas maltophilia]